MLKHYLLTPLRALLALLLVGQVARAQAPTITGLSPARNALVAPRAASVGVTFSQPLQNTAATRGAVRVFSQQRGGLLRDGARATATISGNTLTLDPTTDFKPGEKLLVTTTTAATAANGSTLARGKVHQFTTAVGTAGGGYFEGISNVAITSDASSVAVGDVDGDGDLDLLTANYFNDNVSVRLNDGSGTFSGGSEVTVGNASSNSKKEPSSVVVGDLDGDGDLDLLTANANVNSVSVRLNNGSGTFSGTSEVAVGNSPSEVVVGDVDGDGDLDMVVANSRGNTVSVRLNTGNGTFSGGSDTPTSTARSDIAPRGVALGDLDGDGDLDIVAANDSWTQLGILLNGGDATGSNTGVFSFSSAPAAGISPQGVAVGDLDGDGDLDVLAAGNSGTVTLFNDGKGAFGDYTYLNNVGGDNIVLGDVEGDGDLDFVSSDSGGERASVFLNDGGGVFSSGSRPRISGISKVVVGDVNGDGSLDIITSSLFASSAATICLNQPSPAVTGFKPASAPGGARVTVSGINLGGATELRLNGLSITGFTVSGDGTTLTFTVPLNATSGRIKVTKPQGTATSSTNFVVRYKLAIVALSPARNARAAPRAANVAVTLRPDPMAYSPSLQNTAATRGAVRVFSQQRGGLLRDGSGATVTVSDDVITLNPTTDFRPGETLLVTTTMAATDINNGMLAAGQVHQFTAAVSTAGVGYFAGGSNVAVGSSPQRITVGDVDNDGDLDLLTDNAGGTVSVRLGNGSGGFGSGSEVSVGSTPQSVALGDVDGDGDLDLLAPKSGTSTVSVRLNTGSGTFSGGSEVSVGSGPLSVAVGDLDGDGDLDFVTANATSGTVSVRLNGGYDAGGNTGQFGGGAEVAVGQYPVSTALGDIDRDGDLDLLVVNANSATVSVRLNDGYGAFSGGSEVSVGSNPQSIAVGDVDGNGILDLVVANYSPTTVSVRLGSSSGTFGGGAEVAVSGNPNSVALGDVDGDGDLDLLTANIGGTASVRLNNGSGGFSGGSNPAVNGNSQSVALGDVDGDGDLDLLAVNFNNNTVSVRLNQPPPTITNFTPTRGGVGMSISVSGTNLSGATVVTLNGASVASFAVGGSGTSFTFVVPPGATSGLISVTTPGGTATSSTSFTIVPTPTISSVTPTIGPVGTNVQVSGTNLQEATAVTLNGVTVSSFTVDTGGNNLIFTVPAGATSGLISVTTPGGTATTSTSFTVISIISFAPNPVNSGTTVTVTGSGLSGATDLTLNGAPVTGFVVSNGGNTLTFVVPADVTSGLLSVTTPGGTATSTSSLLVDNVPPTATLSTTAGSSTSTVPIPFTVTFSEGVTGFGAGGVSVTNGTVVSGSVSGSGSTYTFTVLPASYRTVVGVSVGAGATRDAATNASLASNSLSVSYDGPPPLADLLNTGTLLTVQAGGILSVGTGGLGNQGGTLTNAGTLRVAGPLTNPAPATLDLGAGTLEAQGDLSNAGTVRPGTSAVTFSGAADQLLTPGGASLYRVLVSKPTAGANTLRLAGDLTVSNSLALANGLVTTQTGPTLSTLSLPAGATLSGEASGRYVQGSLAVTRTSVSGAAVDFGHGAVLDPATTNLGTVTITRTAGLLADDVSRGVNLANAAQQGIDRIYTVSAATPPSAAVQLTLRWLPDNDNGLTDFSQASAWQQAAAGQPWVARSPATNASTRSLRFNTTTLGRFTVSNAANPLPVTLVDFTAQAEGPATARLRWATASELNNAGFTVERSLDGRTFAVLSTVAGAGTSATRHDYTLLDSQLPTGATLLYYRLGQTDLGGAVTYSPVRSVAFAPRAAGFVVYPTRVATGQALTYLYTGPAEAGQLDVLNVLGQVVSTLALDGRASGPVPLVGLATGTYVLRYTGPAGRFVARCVVE